MRRHWIIIRARDDEYLALLNQSKDSGETMSDIVRKALESLFAKSKCINKTVNT